jgi:hypothetical protein
MDQWELCARTSLRKWRTCQHNVHTHKSGCTSVIGHGCTHTCTYIHAHILDLSLCELQRFNTSAQAKLQAQAPCTRATSCTFQSTTDRMSKPMRTHVHPFTSHITMHARQENALDISHGMSLTSYKLAHMHAHSHGHNMHINIHRCIYLYRHTHTCKQ